MAMLQKVRTKFDEGFTDLTMSYVVRILVCAALKQNSHKSVV